MHNNKFYSFLISHYIVSVSLWWVMSDFQKCSGRKVLRVGRGDFKSSGCLGLNGEGRGGIKSSEGLGSRHPDQGR